MVKCGAESGKTQTILTLENEDILVEILPEMGGKIVQLSRKSSGTDFLKKSQLDLSKAEKPQKGEDFLPPYAAGFDECFPNISPSCYQFKGEVLQLPDHGELWTQSWNYTSDDKEVTLWTKGGRLNYRFAKCIQLVPTGIEITYELESFEEVPFDYIWSAHPLLEVDEGDEILLPDEISEVFVNWVSDSQIGTFNDQLSWPSLGKPHYDFGTALPKDYKFAAKLFSQSLKKGYAGLYRKKNEESLVLSFNVDQTPFLGIWLCYGGWPSSGTNYEYTIALEPCSSYPDSLKEACRMESQQTITPSTIKCWQITVNIVDGKLNEENLNLI